MHISEGMLDARVCLGGYAVTAVLTGAALRGVKKEDIPKVSVMAAAFFVSSLIHFRLGASSVHLTLIGLTGIMLGPFCTLAFLAGLLFQAVLFGHGGLSTLGVNTALFSVPGLLVHAAYSKAAARLSQGRVFRSIWAGVLSGLGIFIAAALVLGVIRISASEFGGIAMVFSLSHAVLALLEGVLTGIAVHQVLRIKPEMIRS